MHPDPKPIGPFEDAEWPSKLKAHVVRPGATPLLHGYDVYDDLARQYRFAEIALLALTGEAPSREQGMAFELALAFLAPTSVGEAALHAAVVARMCGARFPGALATGAVGLCEQARAFVERNAEFLSWLAHPDSPFPEAARAAHEEERRAAERLEGLALERGAVLPTAGMKAGLEASILAAFAAAGLVDSSQLVAALVFAWMPALAAEAAAIRVGSFQDYPSRLPDFEYVEETR